MANHFCPEHNESIRKSEKHLCANERRREGEKEKSSAREKEEAEVEKKEKEQEEQENGTVSLGPLAQDCSRVLACAAKLARLQTWTE